jgi:hypothetical protein
MFLVAALGVLGAAGAASAQNPQPMPTTTPATPGGLPAVAAPAAGAPAQPVPAAPTAPTPYGQAYAPGAPVVAGNGYGYTSGGCCGSAAPVASDCGGSGSGTGARSSLFGHLCHSRLAVGEGCAKTAGCDSCAAEKTFMFGGCSQWFNAGSKCGGHAMGSGCGSCGGGWGGGCGGSGGLLHHGSGCGGGLCGGGGLLPCNCPFHPLGTGGLTSPPCTYFSYLQR